MSYWKECEICNETLYTPTKEEIINQLQVCTKCGAEHNPMIEPWLVVAELFERIEILEQNASTRIFTPPQAGEVREYITRDGQSARAYMTGNCCIGDIAGISCTWGIDGDWATNKSGRDLFDGHHIQSCDLADPAPLEATHLTPPTVNWDHVSLAKRPPK
jgi:hypothetical protein